MSDTEHMPSIYDIRDRVLSRQTGKAPTLDEIKIRSDMMAMYLRIYEDEYYSTDDARFALAYEELYERYAQLRDFYAGAHRLLRGISPAAKQTQFNSFEHVVDR